MLACPYKQGMGIECPGCGLQRSVIELIKGNVADSIMIYPPLLPMLVMFAFLGLHIAFKFKHGALVLKGMFIGVWVAIIVNYIIKII